MKPIAFALMTASLAMNASPALADSRFCEAIETVLELALDDFRTIAGASDSDAEPSKTLFTLPGAENCEILQSGEHPGYWCSWPSTRRGLDGQVQAFAERIADCLGREPDWASNDFSLSAFIVDRGVEFYVRGSEYRGAFEVQLAVEFIGDGNDGSDRHDPRLMLVTNDP